MDKISTRIEAADASEQRELLETAFARIHKISLAPDDWSALHWSYPDRFKVMLDAEAYESAALMLVPEGWSLSISNIVSPGFHVSLMEGGGCREAYARLPLPALAIAEAALKARGL